MLQIKNGLIDTHCHLPMTKNIPANIAAAKAAGVTGIVNVSIDYNDVSELQRLSDSYSTGDLHLWSTIGLHPTHVRYGEYYNEDELVRDAIANKSCIGVGETGLDFLRNISEEAKLEQIKQFEIHIAAAQRLQMPIIIHTRGADQLTTEILEAAHKATPFPILIHCYAMDEEFGKRILDIGGYLSFSGLVTYTKAENTRKAAVFVPEDRMVVETDSPYLTPSAEPRGTKNQPAFVKHNAKALASLRGAEYDSVVTQTLNNFRALFRI